MINAYIKNYIFYNKYILLYIILIPHIAYSSQNFCSETKSIDDYFLSIPSKLLPIVDDEKGELLEAIQRKQAISFVDRRNGYLELQNDTILDKIEVALYRTRNKIPVIIATEDGFSVQNTYVLFCYANEWHDVTNIVLPKLSDHAIKFLYENGHILIDGKPAVPEQVLQAAHTLVRFKLPKKGKYIKAYASHPEISDPESNIFFEFIPPIEGLTYRFTESDTLLSTVNFKLINKMNSIDVSKNAIGHFYFSVRDTQTPLDSYSVLLDSDFSQKNKHLYLSLFITNNVFNKFNTQLYSYRDYDLNFIINTLPHDERFYQDSAPLEKSNMDNFIVVSASINLSTDESYSNTLYAIYKYDGNDIVLYKSLLEVENRKFCKPEADIETCPTIYLYNYNLPDRFKHLKSLNIESLSSYILKYFNAPKSYMKDLDLIRKYPGMGVSGDEYLLDYYMYDAEQYLNGHIEYWGDSNMRL